jgi:3-deoxy-D-manno-octulosonic-acid transferase
MLASLYRFLTDLGAPVIRLYLLKRRAEGREDARRFPERLGHASLERPDGQLVWCHAASVGEAVSLLTLIEKLRDTYPATHVLVTTGTVTSAQMLAGRLPEGVMHQYMPVDRMPYVNRFLNHWQPDLVIWIESELWPNMLSALRDRMIPAVLLNGRMSETSFRNWQKARGWAKDILEAFVLCLTQTEDERTRFAALGAEKVRCLGNIKYAAKPLPCDERALDEVKMATAGRPVWAIASTHSGEERMVAGVHKKLVAKWPNILTVIIPRHAVRGDEVARQLDAADVTFARRSKGETITAATQIYLADTMGELGLFYRLCPIVAMGGSFVAVGGHNPIEPAQLGAAVIFGPHMFNFAEMAREFMERGAALQVRDSDALAVALERWLGNEAERAGYAEAARALAEQKRHVMDLVLAELRPWLAAPERDAA